MNTNQTVPFLKGHEVYLRGLTEEDLEGPMRHWSNDREVTRFMYRGHRPSTPERRRQEHQKRLDPSNDDVELAVIESETDRHIGITGLHSFNWLARSAEFRILIGEKETWGQGYGTEACQLMVIYGFEIFNLHKVWLGVNEANKAAVRSYEKAGFVEEGTLRDEVYRNSQYYDAIRMSMLRDEYEQQRETWAIADLIDKQFPRQ